MKPIRLWPGILAVVLQWFLVHGVGMLAPASVAHFFAFMGGGVLGLLGVIAWWLFASRAERRERWVTLGAAFGLFVLGIFLVHPSTRQAVVIFGVPTWCLAFVASAAVARRRESTARMRLMLGASIVVCLGWQAVRTTGVDGDMNVDYAFRLSATPEERLVQGADLLTAGATFRGAAADVAAPWPGFRGPNRDNRVEGERLATDWESTPPRQLWRRPVGPGWGSFAVVGDFLYTLEQRGEEELVACYRRDSGEPVWVHRDIARFWEALAGAGPRSTPAYDDGTIYALGATGLLNALDAWTGELRWRRDAAEDSGAEIPDWGFASSPLVVDDIVIVHTGGAGREVSAYDKNDGAIRWTARAGKLSYSSAHLATIAGVRQVLLLTGDGAHAYDPADGTLLWEHVWPLSGGARIVQPWLLDDGTVYVGTGFGVGVRELRVTLDGGAWNVAEGWTSAGLKPYYNDFVEHRGALYGFDGRIFAALDGSTGERLWKGGRYGNGQAMLLADQDLLLVLSDRGEVALLDATPDGFSERARFAAIDGKTWNHPVLVDGTLYVRNGEEMAAFAMPTAGP